MQFIITTIQFTMTIPKTLVIVIFLFNIILCEEITIDFQSSGDTNLINDCDVNKLENDFKRCYELKYSHIPNDGNIIVQYSATQSDELSVVLQDEYDNILLREQFIINETNNDYTPNIKYHIDDTNLKYTVSN